MTTRLPWIIKYRPRRVADVINQDQAKEKFLSWLREWLRGKIPNKKAALLYGPAGIGKTSLVEAAAHEYKLELIEMNASDFRRKTDIERVAKVAAMQTSLWGRKRIILLDEVDGISGTADKGGLEALLDLINTTIHPVVLTANDPWDPKLRALRENSLVIGFNRLSERDIISGLRRICSLERISCDDESLRLIAKRSEGDLRSAINDLQAIAEGYGSVTIEYTQRVITSRDREYSPWEMLRNLFMSRYLWQAKRAITHTDLDYETLLEWINENTAYQYNDVEDIYRAYEAISRADIYLGRIKKTGSWDLLSYFYDLLGPGLVSARRRSRFRWVKYQYPQKIVLMARTKEVREIRDAIASIFSQRLLVSKKLFKSDILPFLFIIFKHNPEYAAKIAYAYNLTDNMIRYLGGPSYNEIKRHLLSLERKIAQHSEKISADKVHRKTEKKSRQTTLF